jgi:hypothetical protein
MPHIQVCEILTRTRNNCQSVEGTLDSPPTSVQDMGVDHRGTNVIMSK